MIDSSAIKNIANLSRIKIEDNKLDSFQDEFNKILKWVEQLNEVNTDNIEPLVSVNDGFLECREDKVIKENNAESILANAPEKKYNYFVVPKVVE